MPSTHAGRDAGFAGGTSSRFIYWAAMLFALVMAVVPRPPMLPGEPSDKVQHIVAFIVLALLGRLAYPKTRKRDLLFGLMAFGALIEIAQTIPILHRDADPFDWVADTAAALTVFVIVALRTYFRDKRPSA